MYRRALAIAPACVDLWALTSLHDAAGAAREASHECCVEVQYCEAAGFSDEVNEEHQFAIVCIWMHVARRLQSTFPSNDSFLQDSLRKMFEEAVETVGQDWRRGLSSGFSVIQIRYQTQVHRRRKTKRTWRRGGRRCQAKSGWTPVTSTASMSDSPA